MNHNRLETPTLLAIIVFLAGSVHGQGAATNGQKPQTANVALREKAFDVIDSVASQIGTLQSAENRARLASNIAEALWQRDEKRARALFILIEEDINAGLGNAEGDERLKAQARAVFLQLRINTVERLAKHDTELALSFLKATAPTESTPRTPGWVNPDGNLTLGLAKKIAAANPDLALRLGREALDEGFPYEMIALLKKLNIKHREQATILYGDIIGKLKHVDLKQESWAFYFGLNLARFFKPPAVDDASFRQLISLFKASAMAHGCGNKKSDEDGGGWFCSQIGAGIAEMEKVDPSLAYKSKQSVSEETESNWFPEAYEEVNDVSENGTVDELLALATKYPYLKDDIYGQAVRKAEASGDEERAEKIATDYDGDPDTKQRMLKGIERSRMWAGMNDEKMDQLQQTLSTLPGTVERIDFLMRVAGQLARYDRKTALKLLDQANGMVDSMKPGADQTGAQMGLAIMYCSEKSDRGLAIMESMIPKLNELIAATAKLDGYDHNNLRDGEWNMSSQGSIGAMLTALAQNAAYFAWCDFERAVNLTGQFERPEIRLMAQLKLAQGILAGPPPRIRPGEPLAY